MTPSPRYTLDAGGRRQFLISTAERRRCQRLRSRLVREQGGLCHYCRRAMGPPAPRGGPVAPDSATLDHVIPRARGGRTTPKNCVAACSACNSAKRSGAAPAGPRLYESPGAA